MYYLHNMRFNKDPCSMKTYAEVSFLAPPFEKGCGAPPSVSGWFHLFSPMSTYFTADNNVPFLFGGELCGIACERNSISYSSIGGQRASRLISWLTYCDHGCCVWGLLSDCWFYFLCFLPRSRMDEWFLWFI